MNEFKYMNPDYCRNLPNGSKEKLYGILVLKRMWHKLYDNCPTLLTYLENSSKTDLDKFLVFSEERNYKMGWMIHIEFIDYLSGYHSFDEDDLAVFLKECIGASCLNWASRDRSLENTIVIRHEFSPNKIYLASKKSPIGAAIKSKTGDIEGLTQMTNPIEFTYMNSKNALGEWRGLRFE